MGTARVLTLPAPPAAAAAGCPDEEAFRGFYAVTARPLWLYLRAACGDGEMADDLLQESFLRLLSADLAHEGESGRRAYLYQIASNLLRDHWRRLRRRPEPAPLDDDEVDRGASVLAPDGPRVDVQRALARLSVRDRQLLWLAYVEGGTHREVARALGLGATSVRVLLFRARRRLGALLGAFTAEPRP